MRLDRDGFLLSRNATVKLIGSVVVLGAVLLVAANRQFGARERVDASVEPPAPAEQVERTVFGEPPALPPRTKPRQLSNGESVRARSVIEPTRAEQPRVPQRLADANVPRDLHAFLERWRNTLISGDTRAQADLYAKRVDRFFTKRNVSRDDVRREKEQLLAKYPEFHRYEIGDVRIESMDTNRAVVTFRKDWDARGRGRFAGSERQRLTLIRESGSWKITGEEETKVYWVRRN